MDDTRRNYIYINLNQKDTGELLAIWKKHDQNEWTEQSFDVIRGILESRQVTVPPPDEPGSQPAESTFPAGLEVPTDAAALEQRIKDHETQLQKVQNKKTGSLVTLIVGSAGMALVVCPGSLKYGIKELAIFGGVLLLYVGLNAWRFWRNVEKEKQLRMELNAYRAREAELQVLVAADQ